MTIMMTAAAPTMMTAEALEEAEVEAEVEVEVEAEDLEEEASQIEIWEHWGEG